MTLSQSISLGSMTPTSDGGATAHSPCYDIGGCQFNLLSQLRVTKHLYSQIGDCSLVHTTVVENWLYSSSDLATTITWANGANNWATYAGGHWTHQATLSGYDTSGAGGLCLGEQGNIFELDGCGGFIVYRYFNGASHIILEGLLLYNDCIPQAIA